MKDPLTVVQQQIAEHYAAKMDVEFAYGKRGEHISEEVWDARLKERIKHGPAVIETWFKS